MGVKNGFLVDIGVGMNTGADVKPGGNMGN